MERIKKSLLLFLLFFVRVECLQPQISPVLKHFMSEVHMYRLQAPWLVKNLITMNFHEFSAAWAYIVDVLKNPETRWRFFCDDVSEYQNEKYLNQMLWQCHFFELWLSRVYVSVNDMSLVFDNQGMLKNNQAFMNVVSLWNYLNEQKQGDFTSIYDFYAVYADTLAALLLKGVQIGYVYMDDDIFGDMYKFSISLSRSLKVVIRNLYSSQFAFRYTAQIERYSQLLDRLKYEKLHNALRA